MPSREPGIPLSKIVDNSPANWWPLIAVAFVAVAFVSGFIGYVVRAPQAEMARLNKELSQSKQANKELAAERDDLTGMLDGRDEIIQKLNNSGPDLKLPRDLLLLAFKVDRVDFREGDAVGLGPSRRETWKVNDIDVVFHGPPERLAAVEITGKLGDQKFGKTAGYFMSTFASKWPGDDRVIWFVRAMKAIEDMQPEDVSIVCHREGVRFELARDSANILFTIRPE